MRKIKNLGPSNKLKVYFIILIPLIIAHWLEEYFTGFYDRDIFSRFIFQYFEGMPIYQATFLLFQIIISLLLIVYFILVFKKEWWIYITGLIAFIMIFEIHHLIKAILRLDYYPGLITALFTPILGFLIIKELLRLKKKRK